MSNEKQIVEGRPKYWTSPEFVEVEGVKTAYRRSGKGKTLLYLHGTGATGEWNPLLQRLAESFDVVAPEHPGFGDTPRHPDQDTWEDFILHYDAFIRTLGLSDIHLVGTAFGAWLASNLAVYYPDRFKTLTLVTPMGVLVEDEPFIDLYRLTPEEELDRRFNGRAANLGDEIPPPGDVEDAVRLYSELSTAVRLTWSPRYEPKFDRRLARVSAPALLISAEDDRLLGNGQAQKYAKLLPSATVAVIPGPNGAKSSHGLSVEQPNDVAEAVTKHIKANS